jgi:ATP-dependent helicase/nuclease subunit B
MARAVPRVFTLAPGQNFAELVVRHLLAGRFIDLPFADEPHRLADLVIYVPTQRMRGILEAEFAAQLAPRPAILPRIRPLADPGDALDRLIGAGMTGDELPGGDGFSRPLVSGMQRRFLLLPLIDAWRSAIRHAVTRPEGSAAAPADAAVSVRERLALADELGRLIDEMRIAGLPLGELESTAPPGYDPAKFDIYWEKSRDFLRIAARFWPEKLNEIGARDEMEVRLEAIEAEAKRLQEGTVTTPVLVIGSTGSVAATARLMRAVARLDQGAVILPGLDRDIDARGWDAIGDEKATLATRFAHPQAALKRLLAIIGISREDVEPVEPEPEALGLRNRMLSEALRPAESIDVWRATGRALDLAGALDGVTVIEAAEEREEALAIAILMREALERPEASVAFITANRGLARRVQAELCRWDIMVEDSAGVGLDETPAGTFVQLFLRAGLTREGGAILALLRHPFTRAGFDEADFRSLVDALEILVLRGRFFSAAQSLQERVRYALDNPPYRAHPAVARIPDTLRGWLPRLAKTLDDLFRPFAAGAPAQSLGEFARDLFSTLRLISQDEAGLSALDGEASATSLGALLDEIGAHAGACLIAPEALGSALDLLMGGTTLPPGTGHPRAAILGQLESRLIAADRVIVGGLNEGSFPPAAQEGPFLNRSMRIDLGLQPPERRIGQSAHDFGMLAGNREIFLTRARREGEQPSMASRFLRRLAAFVGDDHWKMVLARGETMLALARRLDAPETFVTLAPPMPVPAVPRVPARLSITEIETLRRDPYAIYARHILGLVPLEPIDPEIDARERGTLLHACLEDYARRDPPEDPEQAGDLLRAIGEAHFAAIRQERELYQFWWQRFLAIVPDFVAFDRRRREAGWTVLPEVGGKVPLVLPSGDSLTISGKVDRVEINAAGELAIFDYKSGLAPSSPTIGSGLAPQLPISAALARAGAFADVPAGADVASLAYVTIGGSGPLAEKPVDPGKAKAESLGELVERNWRRLVDDLDAIATGAAAYQSRKAVKAGSVGDYDHLARVDEWQTLGAGTDESQAAGEETE